MVRHGGSGAPSRVFLFPAVLNLPKPDTGWSVSHVFREVVTSFFHVTESLAPLWMALRAEPTRGCRLGCAQLVV